jgi:ABC-type lipoprotein release transport system permease subunit
MGVPLPLVLGLTDLSARPLRSLLTGLNLALGVVGIVFGLALTDTLDTYRRDPSLLGIAHDAIVTRHVSSDRQARHLLSMAPGVSAFYGEITLDAETPEGLPLQVRAVHGDVEPFPFRIAEGRFFRPGTFEAIAGRGLLNWMRIEVGDSIIVTLDGTSHPVLFTIVGQYPEAANAGRMLMIGLPAVARRIGDPEPGIYYLKLDPDCDVAQLEHHLTPGQDGDLNLTTVPQAIPDEVHALQLALFALSGTLVTIALINVFNTSLLAMQEKTRSIAILKTIGMTPLQVVAMAGAAAALLGLLAAALGLPAGLLLTGGLLNTLSDYYGFGRVDVAFSPLHAAYVAPLVILLSAAGSAIPGRWAARASVVQDLRGE